MNELVKVNPKEFGIEENQANEITKGLAVALSERESLITEFNSVSTLEITEENLKSFKELRLRIVKNRTQGIEVWHKASKEYFLRGGQFCDAIKRREIQVNESMETVLMEAEKHFENLEKERIAKLRAERIELLSTVCDNPELFQVESMSNEGFDQLYKGQKLAKEKQIEEARIAEEKRIEAEKKEAEERERMRIENERLKKEAEEKEAQLRKEREESERKAKAEREKAEAQRKAIEEKARKEREELQKKADEKLRLEREERIRLENIEKERLAKEQAERKARELAEKKAKAAPDKIKLEEFARSIDSMIMPEIKSSEAKLIINNSKSLLLKVSVYIREQTNNL